MLRFAKHCSKALLYLVFPPICLHCGDPIEEKSLIFCCDCLGRLEPIDPLERCPYCFSADFYLEKKVCPECFRCTPLLNRIAAAFDYIGPAADLVKEMKYGNRPYLAKGAAAYMAAQFYRLDWPTPDYIIPVPLPLTRWIQRGYNQSHLLAESLSKFLNRPLLNGLHRICGDFSQAGLSREQRMALSPSSFRFTKKVNLEDKCLLLVDDVMTTGSTLRCCAEILLEECPKSIYGLTVCRAIK